MNIHFIHLVMSVIPIMRVRLMMRMVFATIGTLLTSTHGNRNSLKLTKAAQLIARDAYLLAPLFLLQDQLGFSVPMQDAQSMFTEKHLDAGQLLKQQVERTERCRHYQMANISLMSFMVTKVSMAALRFLIPATLNALVASLLKLILGQKQLLHPRQVKQAPQVLLRELILLQQAPRLLLHLKLALEPNQLRLLELNLRRPLLRKTQVRKLPLEPNQLRPLELNIPRPLLRKTQARDLPLELNQLRPLELNIPRPLLRKTQARDLPLELNQLRQLELNLPRPLRRKTHLRIQHLLHLKLLKQLLQEPNLLRPLEFTSEAVHGVEKPEDDDIFSPCGSRNGI
mmetsp:Transcript_5769/g.8941  ORF Transcript_5769/g.8941 Transcript_5769/m.8941 type:complete len:341 (-) Transcript_5769:1126-2148(-)